MNIKRIAVIALSLCIAAAAPAEAFAEGYQREDKAEAAGLQTAGDRAYPEEAEEIGQSDPEENSLPGISGQDVQTIDDAAGDETDAQIPQAAPEEQAEQTDLTGDADSDEQPAGDGNAADVSASSEAVIQSADKEPALSGTGADGGSSGLPSEETKEDAASADRANLRATIADAKTRSTGSCTAGSAALFQAAIGAAEEVADDDGADAEQLQLAEQMLVKTFMALMTKESDASALEKAKSGSYDGIYTVSGKLMHATSADQESMGNPALKKPFQVIVEKGKPTLRLEFVPLTSKLGKTTFTGYLGKMNYFPGYTGSTVPAKITPTGCAVESWYDTVDAYNDPKTGSDPNMRGKKYPHVVQLPADFSKNSCYVQVYVSVMEAISAGSGTQFARMVTDWSTLKQTAGTVTEQTALKRAANLLSSFQSAYSAGKVKAAFSDKKLQLLKKAVASGEAAAADMNITQAEVDATTAALTAVSTFLDIREAADKTKLHAAITKADSLLAQTWVYTAATLKVLKEARDQGNKVYQDYLAAQKEVDARTAAINTAVKGLKKITVAKVKTAKVSRTKLKAALDKAKKLLKKTKKYTKKSLKKLKKARSAANKVYKNKTATQAQVDQQTKKLKAAIKKLKKKNSSASGGKTASGTSGGSSSAKQEKADFNNLTDGVYTISGSMVKIDRSTASMSNDAIDHTMKLTVKGGTYYITMRFKGLKINNMLGYLGKLRYFQTGYTLDGNGSPQGSLQDATVESYQTDGAGKRVSDDLGSDYPREVTFPLISEAMQDGFVPLQVFVPVMESISAGTGTQPVYLKLDRNSVYTGFSGSSDSGAAGQSALPAGSAGSGGAGTGTKTAGSSLPAGSSLGGSLPGAGDAEADASEDDAGEEEDDTDAGSTLGGLGSPGGAASEETAEETDAVEAAEAEAAAEDANAPAEEEEQEPPLRKLVKPMGIGTPLLALMLAAIYLRRRGRGPWSRHAGTAD